jgi:predicted alpha/beta-hydrolase family hydrolase
MPEKVIIEVGDNRVTGLIYAASARNRKMATLLLGHGAGAGQTSDFMVSFARGLSARGIEAVTFNFLYAESGRRAPDRNDRLEDCYRAAIEATARHKKLKGNRLLIGGKSMGGRIASQVAARGERVAGLVFLGYPLHPPGKPEQKRDSHLAAIQAPMLFVQGGRDPFGTPEEVRDVIRRLRLDATVYEVEGGDHSFAVPKKWPVPQEEIFKLVQDEIAGWVGGLK